jgi:hypothetical protein
MGLMREAHGVGKGVFPGALVVDRVALWIAGRQRLDQLAFRRGDAADQREGSAGRVMGTGERRGLTGGVLQFPGVVVVRPDRVGAPAVIPSCWAICACAAAPTPTGRSSTCPSRPRARRARPRRSASRPRGPELSAVSVTVNS